MKRPIPVAVRLCEVEHNALVSLARRLKMLGVDSEVNISRAMRIALTQGIGVIDELLTEVEGRGSALCRTKAKQLLARLDTEDGWLPPT